MNKNKQIFKLKKHYTKSGFTVVELVITLALSALVLIICARLFFSAGSIASLTSYFNSQEVQTRYTAEMINNAIKYTNALFTIPKSSFTQDNLTESWSYLGVMDDVTIPKALIEEREGETVAEELGESFSTTALVYIKYIGTTATVNETTVKASLSTDQTLLKNADGYFIQTVFDYEHYNVKLGYSTKYELVFNTTNDEDSANVISDSIKYSLKVTYYDEDGNKVGTGTNIDLETMLNGLNLLQAVYQGSSGDPATAIAFHEDAFNVSVKKGAPLANIVFVLDLSGSMDSSISSSSSKTRIKALQENVTNFVKQFASYDTVYIGFVQFSNYGINAIMPKQASSSASTFYTYINGLNNKTDGGTNLGDGVRVAYSQFKYIENNHLNDGASNFLIIITDGYMNGWSTSYATSLAADVTNYNTTLTNYKNASKKSVTLLDTNLARNLVTVNDIGKFYWDESNTTGKPDCVVYCEGSTKNFFLPNLESSLHSFNSSKTYSYNYTYKNISYKYSFTYTQPTTTQLSGYAQSFMEFCADNFKTATFAMPAVKLLNISNYSGSDEQSAAIMNAFSTTTNYTENYSYSINDEASFIDCVATLAADITTSAWLLDGPRT
jgi:Mg-chelatase subunit ChlD